MKGGRRMVLTYMTTPLGVHVEGSNAAGAEAQ